MKDPAVLFYFQDFLVGTEFMTDDEVGKYIRILCHLADKGALSLTQLKQICGNTMVIPPESIMSKLRQDENGMYYQQRMRDEREKRMQHCEKQRENIKKRWKKNEYHGNTTVIPLEDENINKDSIINNIDSYWEKWKKYKRDEFRFKYKSEVSENAAKKELLNLSGNDEEIAIKIIEQSIANGWKGFFELKEDGRVKKSNGATTEDIFTTVVKNFGAGQ